jgi:hypothetical protein
MGMMENSIGLPFKSKADKHYLLSLTNNTAVAYGGDVASLPCDSFVVTDAPASIIPGIDLLNVSIALKDCFGQVVKGTPEISIPYILDFWICSIGACSIEQSLAPLKFVSFDSVSGIGSSLAAEQTVLCAESTPNITVYFSVYGASQSINTNWRLVSSVRMSCMVCGSSQVRIEKQVQDITTWACARCLPGYYIIDPNKDSCQKCPLGTTPRIDKQLGGKLNYLETIMHCCLFMILVQHIFWCL